MKGYNTGDGYMGFVDGRYILFASEADYYEYMTDQHPGLQNDGQHRDGEPEFPILRRKIPADLPEAGLKIARPHFLQQDIQEAAAQFLGSRLKEMDELRHGADAQIR